MENAKPEAAVSGRHRSINVPMRNRRYFGELSSSALKDAIVGDCNRRCGTMLGEPSYLTSGKPLRTSEECSVSTLKLGDSAFQRPSPHGTVFLLEDCISLTAPPSQLANAITGKDPMMKSLESGDGPDPNIVIAIFQNDPHIITGQSVRSRQNLSLTTVLATQSM